MHACDVLLHGTESLAARTCPSPSPPLFAYCPVRSSPGNAKKNGNCISDCDNCFLTLRLADDRVIDGKLADERKRWLIGERLFASILEDALATLRCVACFFVTCMSESGSKKKKGNYDEFIFVGVER